MGVLQNQVVKTPDPQLAGQGYPALSPAAGGQGFLLETGLCSGAKTLTKRSLVGCFGSTVRLGQATSE